MVELDVLDAMESPHKVEVPVERRNSPSVSSGRPAAFCLATSSAMQASSTARPCVVERPAACAARAS
ncbi:MAG: hypothetical protein ACLTKG_05400 [Collinsella intestinalis]